MSEEPEQQEAPSGRKGHLLGMPYNLTKPTGKSDALSSLWNRDDARLFTPKRFGWGYDINLYWLAHPFEYLGKKSGS